MNFWNGLQRQAPREEITGSPSDYKEIGQETDSLEKKKQDCESKAFKRLAERLKKTFPRLGTVLMMDILYASGPVLGICRKSHWDYMINFKEGRIPTVYKEAKR